MSSALKQPVLPPAGSQNPNSTTSSGNSGLSSTASLSANKIQTASIQISNTTTPVGTNKTVPTGGSMQLGSAPPQGTKNFHQQHVGGQQVYGSLLGEHGQRTQNMMSAHQQSLPNLAANMAVAHQQAVAAHHQSIQQTMLPTMPFNKQLIHSTTSMGNTPAVAMPSPVNMAQDRTNAQHQPCFPHATPASSSGFSPSAPSLHPSATPPAHAAPTNVPTTAANSGQCQSATPPSIAGSLKPSAVVEKSVTSDSISTTSSSAVSSIVTPLASVPNKPQANGTVETTTSCVSSTETPSASQVTTSTEPKSETPIIEIPEKGANKEHDHKAERVKTPEGSPATVKNEPSRGISSPMATVPSAGTPATVKTAVNSNSPTISSPSESVSIKPTAIVSASAPQITANTGTLMKPLNVVESTPKTPTKSPSTLKLATTPRTNNKRKRESVSKSPKALGESPVKQAKVDSTPRSHKSPSGVGIASSSKIAVGDDKGGKRVRVRTQPYQSPLPSELALFTKLSSTQAKQSPANDDKLIAFYKHEFLAVRNAEGGFYVCQTVQNIYKTSTRIRIRWLSNHDKSTDVYSPDFYDFTDFDCILTNLSLNKLEKGKYRLPKDELERTENILKRALDVEKGVSTSMSVTEEHPDGLDLSLLRDESQLKKRRSLKAGGSKMRKRQATTTPRSTENNLSSPKSERRGRKRTHSLPKTAPKVASGIVTKQTTSTISKIIPKGSTSKRTAAPKRVNPITKKPVVQKSSSPTIAKKVNSSSSNVTKKVSGTGRSQRYASRRSDSSSNSNVQSHPVDAKKAKVLAKVAGRRNFVNSSAPATKVVPKQTTSVKAVKVTPISTAIRGTRSGGTTQIASTSRRPTSKRPGRK